MERLAKMAQAYLDGLTSATEFRDQVVLHLVYHTEPDTDEMNVLAAKLAP
jgi:hypothetical protein